MSAIAAVNDGYEDPETVAPPIEIVLAKVGHDNVV